MPQASPDATPEVLASKARLPGRDRAAAFLGLRTIQRSWHGTHTLGYVHALRAMEAQEPLESASSGGAAARLQQAKGMEGMEGMEGRGPRIAGLPRPCAPA